MIIVTGVQVNKNPVSTGEKFYISISVRETVMWPNMYRLPFKLGEKKGGIK